MNTESNSRFVRSRSHPERSALCVGHVVVSTAACVFSHTVPNYAIDCQPRRSPTHPHPMP
eukprot:gene3711-6255_t